MYEYAAMIEEADKQFRKSFDLPVVPGQTLRGGSGSPAAAVRARDSSPPGGGRDLAGSPGLQGRAAPDVRLDAGARRAKPHADGHRQAVSGARHHDGRAHDGGRGPLQGPQVASRSTPTAVSILVILGVGRAMTPMTQANAEPAQVRRAPGSDGRHLKASSRARSRSGARFGRCQSCATCRASTPCSTSTTPTTWRIRPARSPPVFRLLHRVIGLDQKFPSAMADANLKPHQPAPNRTTSSHHQG